MPAIGIGGLEVIEHCICITKVFYFAYYGVPDEVYLENFQCVTLHAALRIRCIEDSMTEYNNDSLCNFPDLLMPKINIFEFLTYEA